MTDLRILQQPPFDPEVGGLALCCVPYLQKRNMVEHLRRTRKGSRRVKGDAALALTRARWSPAGAPFLRTKGSVKPRWRLVEKALCRHCTYAGLSHRAFLQIRTY